MGLRCEVGLHKWSKWDLFHRWCLRCRKMQTTPLGKAVVKRIINEVEPRP